MDKDFISINDELQEIKAVAKANNIEVKKIEKIGNANMAAFKIYYTLPGNEDIKDNFFWRHDMDKIIQFFHSLGSKFNS
jgi:hypothetical protein